MIYPTIHLNGSHGPTLLGHYLTALKSATKALEVLQDIPVHGRDYYVQEHVNPNATGIAMADHRQRVAALAIVVRELEMIAANVQEQVRARGE
tara:strand:+ start:2350 stop:2628 length:279 start_codon:yes stop_codon:yes gene_type:complete